METNDLRLYEKALLLALKDKKGTIEPGTMYHLALGSAILAELFLMGRLKSDESGRKPMVALADRSRTGDKILDEALETVRTAKRRGAAATWVSRFSRIKRLRGRIAQGLVRKGVLRADERKVLLLFTQRIYPELNPGPEKALRAEIEEAVRGRGEVSPELTVFIALSYATGLLRAMMDRKTLKERKKRIEEISEGNAIGRATKEVVAAVQAAIVIATVTPAIATTVSS